MTNEMQEFLKASEVCARLEKSFCPLLFTKIGLDEDGIFCHKNQRNWKNPAFAHEKKALNAEIYQH